MAHKTLINGTAYEISGGKTLVNGIGYSIDKGKTLVGGTAYNISFGVSIGSLPVGNSIFLNFKGQQTEFIIVHQGKPSALYDNSCDGTWVLMKDPYTESIFHDWDLSYEDSINNYAQSIIHTDINDLVGEFDANIQSNIKQIKLPYCNGGSGNGSNWGTVYSGANGLLTKIFLLSWHEVGLPTDLPDVDEEDYDGGYIAIDGAKLDYFIFGLGTDANNRRKAKGTHGYYSAWWLRTPNKWFSDVMYNVSDDGKFEDASTYQEYSYVRPAFILNPSTTI